MELADQYTPFEYPFKSHFLSWADGRLHYVDEGQGPPIVFIHGHRSSSYLFRNLIKELMADHRCLALDFHGFGLSSASASGDHSLEWQSEQLKHWLKLLNLPPYWIITQGSGGAVGLAHATRNPRRLSGLILSHPWLWPIRLSAWQRFRIWGEDQKRTWRHIFQTGFRLRGVRTALQAFFAKKSLHARTFPTSPKPIQAFGKQEKDWMKNRSKELTRLSHLPCLILWSDRNRQLNQTERKKWPDIFPQTQIRILQRGHFLLPESQPEAVHEAIRQFLQTPTSAPHQKGKS